MAKECPKCGSPHQPGLILCKFCRTAFDEEEARQATPCPRCKDLFAPTTQKCPRCDVWLVVQCVFCNALSPYHHAECDRCGEVFAGAPARKAARDAAGPSVPWPTAPAAPAAPAAGAHDFDAWARPASPQKDVSELFSTFGQTPAEGPASTPGQGQQTGWDLDSWAAPKRQR